MVVIKKGKRFIKRKARSYIYRKIRKVLIAVTLPIVASFIIYYIRGLI